MEQNHGRNSLLEKELKKGVVKSTAPIGLIITALGLGIVMIIGSYLIKYIRGPLPLNEVYNTEQVKNEYVTLHVQYVLDSFMETYKTRSGIRTKSDTYYLILMRSWEPYRCGPPFREVKSWNGLWINLGLFEWGPRGAASGKHHYRNHETNEG